MRSQLLYNETLNVDFSLDVEAGKQKSLPEKKAPRDSVNRGAPG